MTVRIIEVEDGNGQKKWHAYHAHIIFHGDQNSVDFNPDDNSTVEVMAELPHSSHLAAMMSAKQMNLPEGMRVPPRQAMIAVACPDPKCGSVTYYPATGDPEARAVHARYAEDVTGDNHQRRLAMDLNDPEHLKALHAQIKPYVANAWARADLGLHPTVNHDHLDVMVDGQKRTIVPSGHKSHKALVTHAETQRSRGVVFGGVPT